MYGSVIHRLGQELQGKDLSEAQDFALGSTAFAAIDGIGAGPYYSGLQTLRYSDFQVRVLPGRLWRQGQAFNRAADPDLRELAEIISLANFLPITKTKKVALAVWGRQIETDVQERDFLVDFISGSTERRAVPMREDWLAQIEVINGEESTAPVLPVIPNGMLHFCTVLLSPAGIQQIEMVEANRLPRAADLYLTMAMLNAWRARISSQLEGLRAALAALADILPTMAKRTEVIALLTDVAVLKRMQELPSTYAQYGADTFATDSETDPTQAGYTARIDDGLLFPTDAIAVTPLALLSPLDAGASYQDGLLLPAYEPELRLSTSGYTGESIPMAVEQATWEYKTIKFNTWIQTLCVNFNQYANWWVGQFRNYGMTDYRVNKISRESYAYHWNNDWVKHWRLEPMSIEILSPGNPEQITGAIIAQTFIAPTGWATAIDLYFAAKGTSGDVTVLLCPVSETGRPLIGQVYARKTLPYSAIQLHPAPTRFDIKPSFMDGGDRYAICIVSSGIHRLATVSGSRFTEGNLFTATGSGDFFVGDLNKDLLFGLHTAKFKSPRTVMTLQPASLAGGISDMKLRLEQRLPSGCELEIQYQTGGVWHTLNEQEYHLGALPNLLPLRAVFLGTSSVQPGLTLPASTIEVNRAKNSFVHWSKQRILPGASTEILVKIHSFAFLPGSHTLGCTLHNGSTTYNSSISSIRAEPDGSHWHIFEFSLSAPGISSYRIKLVGTRPNAQIDCFSVVERIDIAL